MKEKNCVNCKNFLYPKIRLNIVGEAGLCLINHLFVNNPEKHTCGMYGEKEKK